MGFPPLGAALAANDADKAKPYIKFIKMILNYCKHNPITKMFTVYRAPKLTLEQIADWKVGHVFQNMMSTSLNPTVPDFFKGEAGIILEIRVPSGALNITSIQEFSMYSHEHEYLIPPTARCIVEEVVSVEEFNQALRPPSRVLRGARGAMGKGCWSSPRCCECGCRCAGGEAGSGSSCFAFGSRPWRLGPSSNANSVLRNQLLGCRQAAGPQIRVTQTAQTCHSGQWQSPDSGV
jgi:hypothetical protein